MIELITMIEGKSARNIGKNITDVVAFQFELAKELNRIAEALNSYEKIELADLPENLSGTIEELKGGIASNKQQLNSMPELDKLSGKIDNVKSNLTKKIKANTKSIAELTDNVDDYKKDVVKSVDLVKLDIKELTDNVKSNTKSLSSIRGDAGDFMDKVNGCVTAKSKTNALSLTVIRESINAVQKRVESNTERIGVVSSNATTVSDKLDARVLTNAKRIASNRRNVGEQLDVLEQKVNKMGNNNG